MRAFATEIQWGKQQKTRKLNGKKKIWMHILSDKLTRLYKRTGYGYGREISRGKQNVFKWKYKITK